MKRFTKALVSVLALIFLMPTAAHAYYFPDVPDSNSRSIAIDFLYVLGMVQGNPDGTFAPTRPLNRAEFAKMIVTLLEDDLPAPAAKCFNDVPVDAWFAPYVCKAKEWGLMRGDGGAGVTFGPSRQLNTAEILAVMDRLFEWESPESQGEWYETYLAGAEMRNVSDMALVPEAAVQRQHFAEIMARSLVIYDAEAPAFTGDSMYDDFFNYEEITPEDCAEDEIYDAETQTCELDCSIEGLCEEAQEGVDQLAEYVEGSGTEFVEGAASNILATYDIKEEILVPTAAAQHKAIWELFATLFPAEQRKDFNEFQIFSDGPDQFLAAVILSEKEPKKWVLSVDLTDSFNADGSMQTEALTETLIHEFAHVLTLRIGQLRYDSDLTFDAGMTNDEMLAEAHARCKTYHTGEGCSFEDSYMWKFYTKFWKTIVQDHPTKGNAMESAPEEDVVAFYNAHKNQFLTEYAATNPAEDIAESFVFFIVKDKPTANTTADQKISFFWDFPELVTLRSFIRNRLR